MRILFFGSGEFAVPTFDSIGQDGHDIVAAVTQPDKPSGRGRAPKPTPLKAAAMEAGVPVIDPQNVNAPDVIEHIISLKADLAYVAAFGQWIGKKIRTAFPVGIVNLHGSLLPHLRGAAPIQWSVINGDAQTGVTLFRIVRRMDAGPIIIQRRTMIGEDETASELHDRLARIGRDAVREGLRMLEADPQMAGAAQDESCVTLAPKLAKSDGCIRFDTKASVLARRVCGFWSWPGASCRFQSADGKRDEVITLARAIPYEGPARPSKSPDDIGRITEVMAVQALDAELTILEVKPRGGRLMTWPDFVNGRHVKPGDRLCPIEAS